ncbi:MAG TPA: hypothetical protein EYP98_02495 [Planctomycetes bacterium]|nr:hypothetical protein [Planctomycetota bacterium]
MQLTLRLLKFEACRSQRLAQLGRTRAKLTEFVFPLLELFLDITGALGVLLALLQDVLELAATLLDQLIDFVRRNQA